MQSARIRFNGVLRVQPKNSRSIFTMALPNSPMEIVFSFDTTGSMHSCLTEVRSRVSDMVQRLQADIPGIKIAIFAHGDYCDMHTYITKFVDFTDDVVELCDFVKNVQGTGGGDADECYELVLHEVRTELSWTPGSQRALVMIGDCNPHEPSYPQNKLKLDWRKEADALGENGVRIYSVQCKDYATSNHFYSDIAKRTVGHHLHLDDFKNVFDFLMAVCYREKGVDFLENYEKEVRARCEPIHKDLHVLFGGLRDAVDAPSTSTSAPSSKVTKANTHAKTTAGKKATKTPASVKTIATKKVKSTEKHKHKIASQKFKVPKRFAKYQVKCLPKLQREKVPKNNFMLDDMRWSKWQLVIAPEENDVTPKPRVGCGYRAKRLFEGQTHISALYEVAVQRKASGKKFVVFTKCSKLGFDCGNSWERKLFSKTCIRSQLQEVVKNGCSVFVRRTSISGGRAMSKVKQSIGRYDYAWNANRQVVKDSVNISSNMEVDV